MEDWLADRERTELRSQVIEGCTQMASIYLEVE